MAKLPEGVFVRHQRKCASRTGGACDCAPTYQAKVYDRASGRRKSRSFPTTTAARNWRQDAAAALRRGSFQLGRPVTIQQAGAEWVEAARGGLVRNRSGDLYKPSSLRSYEDNLRLRVYPALGPALLTDVRRSDLQRLIARWLAEGLAPSTIRNTLMPLRAIYRRAISLDEVTVNPTAGLELPAVRGSRDRFASPTEAAALIAAAPLVDRALWATALYAGLRRGELQALAVPDVDLAAGVIRVRHGWDRKEGKIKAKSEAGTRSVPIVVELRDELVEHRMRLERERGLMFGRTPEVPFTADVPQRRAERAWKKAGLEPITLHEARHTCASFFIAAGVNAKALSVFLGHSSIKVTFDLYGHLMPGAENEAAMLVNAYLERAQDEARKGAVGG